MISRASQVPKQVNKSFRTSSFILIHDQIGQAEQESDRSQNAGADCPNSKALISPPQNPSKWFNNLATYQAIGMSQTELRSQPLRSAALRAVSLIATDMDGTLTQRDKFTPALLQVLTDLTHAGVAVVIVTGRSAGWVQAIVNYLPIAGAIAENGGLFYRGGGAASEFLLPIADMTGHRQKLAEMFRHLQAEFPQIQESSDNRFRLTDWTFAVQDLSAAELQQMDDRCQSQGWSFTYSTVQCHIKLPGQEKAIGLSSVLNQHFPQYSPQQIVTVGDSPNDQSLFDRQRFPLSVGVANILHYGDRLIHQPAFVTTSAESQGFCELAEVILGYA